MSADWYRDVRDFHDRFGVDIGHEPQEPTPEVVALREALITEEFVETVEAMRAGDLEGIADGLADLIYVSLGAAVTYGIDLRPVWDEVHRSNMAKQGGATRADGKILKPEGWTPPDVAGVLARQSHTRNRPSQEVAA